MLAFPTSAEQHTGIFSHSNKARKRNKEHPNWEGKAKMISIEDDMIFYMQNSKDYIRKHTCAYTNTNLSE